MGSKSLSDLPQCSQLYRPKWVTISNNSFPLSRFCCPFYVRNLSQVSPVRIWRGRLRCVLHERENVTWCPGTLLIETGLFRQVWSPRRRKYTSPCRDSTVGLLSLVCLFLNWTSNRLRTVLRNTRRAICSPILQGKQNYSRKNHTLCSWCPSTVETDVKKSEGSIHYLTDLEFSWVSQKK